jgi:hypothetical protein
MRVYFGDDDAFDPEAARQERAAYLEQIQAMDFRGSPDRARYFVHDFFNDGMLARFDYDPHANTLVLQMESVMALNDVYDLRVRLGLPREMPHQCEDFSYTCRFRGVAYLAVRRHLMRHTRCPARKSSGFHPTAARTITSAARSSIRPSVVSWRPSRADLCSTSASRPAGRNR